MSHHKCKSDTDDDNTSDEELEYENTKKNVAFSAEVQLVFAAPVNIIIGLSVVCVLPLSVADRA